MLTTLKGQVFLGLGRRLHCSRCDNDVQEHIVGTTSESGFFSIPVGAMSVDIGTSARCPICHEPTPVPEPRFKTYEEMLNEQKQLHSEFLDAGREQTKAYFNSLNWLGKKVHLGRLRRFGFSALADYLER
jgi:hypothetical protein